MLQAGTKAPDFTLNDKGGNPVTLFSGEEGGSLFLSEG